MTVNFKKIVFIPDGDQIMACYEDFVNIQESPCGFGKTEEEAQRDLISNELGINIRRK